MKKILCSLFAVFILTLAGVAFAADTSTDKLILEWNTDKVWVDNGNLCVQGTFKNNRSDIQITKLNKFVTCITFTKEDGSKEAFIGVPKLIPTCKVQANGSRKMSFNLGKYDKKWKSWITQEEYEYTYRPAALFN